MVIKPYCPKIFLLLISIKKISSIKFFFFVKFMQRFLAESRGRMGRITKRSRSSTGWRADTQRYPGTSTQGSTASRGILQNAEYEEEDEEGGGRG